VPLKPFHGVVAVLAAVLVVAGAAVFWSRSDPAAVPLMASPAEATAIRGEAPTPDASGAEPTQLSTSSPPHESAQQDSASPIALLASGKPFVDAIAAAAATYGIDDYRTRRALMYARSLCASPDPSGSLALPMPDPSRDWVFESIAELCAGFDALKVDESRPMTGEPESLLAINRSLGSEAAVAAAEQQLARESDPLLLQEAAQLAWENGRAPSAETMGVNPEAVGPGEHMAAISDAVQLLSCTELGGCGPRSWQTLSLCVRIGCRPGTGFEPALRAHHNEQQLRLIEGYARWMRALRSG
jgi:hypothetical protein